jgi:hypothetical protein
MNHLKALRQPHATKNKDMNYLCFHHPQCTSTRHPLAISNPMKSHYGLKVTFEKAVRFLKVLHPCEMKNIFQSHEVL